MNYVFNEFDENINETATLPLSIASNDVIQRCDNQFELEV